MSDDARAGRVVNTNPSPAEMIAGARRYDPLYADFLAAWYAAHDAGQRLPVMEEYFAAHGRGARVVTTMQQARLF